MRISALNVYPVKGARGVPTTRSSVDLPGLRGDRRWMVVEPDGRFVTQRELSALALLDAVPDADGLHLSFPGTDGSDGGERFVPVPDGGERFAVRVWKDTVDAAAAGEEDDRALSRWFGRPLRLVHFDEAARRGVSRDWVEHDAPVGFADGFPLLVATEASLRALNRAIVAGGAEAVPMNRFRPNIVVADTQAFAEDEWATIRVGSVVLDLVKPCARCTVTTVEQSSGVMEGPEPLASLTRSRMSGDRRAPGVLFGWNAVPRAAGEVAVGDAVEVLERREGGWPLRQPKAA